MAITNEQQQNIIALTVGLFNAAPGAQYLTELSEVFEANGNSYAALTDFIVSTPAFNAQYAGRVTVENKVTTALNLLGVPAEGEAREEATAYFLERAEAGASEAEILLEAVQFLQGDVAEKYADIKAAFANKIEVATTYSVEQQQSSTNLETLKGVIANVTSDPATVEEAEENIIIGTGQTFTLTDGIDNLQGTAGNDRFIGDNDTTSAADQLVGGAGRDTFDFFAADGTLPQMQGIEVLNLRGATANHDTTGAEGLEEAWLVGNPTNGLTTNVNAGVTAGLQNLTTNTQTFTFGTAAEASAVLSGATVNTALNLDNASGTNLKTLNLVATGASANTVAALASNGTETTVNVSGDQSLSINGALADSVTTVDASENSAGVNVLAGNANVAFTGGAGDDTVRFAATQFNADDTVDGGEGRDTLVVGDDITGAGADALFGAVNAVSNIEVLGLSAGQTGIDLDDVTAMNSFALLANAAYTFTNSTSEDSFYIDNSAGNGNTVSITNKTGQQVANVEIDSDDAAAAQTLTALTVGQASEINLASNGDSENVITTVNLKDNSQLNITGEADLEIGGFGGTSQVSIDAAELEGKLTVTGTGGEDIISVGTGGSEITQSALKDSYTFGDGEDSLVVTADAKSEVDVVTGFDVAEDTIDVSGWTDGGSNAGGLAAGDLVSQANVQGAVNATGTTDFSVALGAAANAIGADGLGAFQFDGDTYVLINDGTAGYAAADDQLIQLVGEQTLTADNFVF